MSSGYKNYIADKGLNDETYTSDGVALIRVSGTSPHNNKVVQVEAVSFLACLACSCLSDFSVSDTFIIYYTINPSTCLVMLRSCHVLSWSLLSFLDIEASLDAIRNFKPLALSREERKLEY